MNLLNDINSLFKEKYSEYNLNEKDILRGVIQGMEPHFTNPYFFIQDDKIPLCELKYKEIIDKFLFGGDIIIQKTRVCGITRLLIKYIAWHIRRRKEQGIKTDFKIWWIGANSRLVDNTRIRINEIFTENHIKVFVNRKYEISGENWNIKLIPMSAFETNIKGCEMPDIVIGDEFYNPMEDIARIDGYLSRFRSNKIIQLIMACTDPDDQLAFNYSFTEYNMNQVTVQWFHDKSKCSNLRWIYKDENGEEEATTVIDIDTWSSAVCDSLIKTGLEHNGRLTSDWYEYAQKIFKLPNTEEKEEEKTTTYTCEPDINTPIMTASEASKVLSAIEKDLLPYLKLLVDILQTKDNEDERDC